MASVHQEQEAAAAKMRLSCEDAALVRSQLTQIRQALEGSFDVDEMLSVLDQVCGAS